MKNIITSFLLLASATVIAQSATDSANIYFKKGKSEAAERRWLTANQHFDKAIQFNPQLTEAYLANAQTLTEMRKVTKAKENYEKLHELQPKQPDAIKALMELNYNYRRFDEAISFANQCLNCPQANRIIGMSYYQQEDYSAAEKYLVNAVKNDPNDAEATYTLARTYLDIEEYKKALPWYEKAAQLPTGKNSWMYELGLLYYNNNDYKNAVVAFEKAAAMGYETKNDFNENLGFASLYAGQYEKGEQLLKAVLKRKSNNKTLMRDMAEIFYGQKQYDKSLEYCQMLMELDPNDGKALYQAGLNFQKKGQKDRGQQMCDKAIEMDPSLNSLRKKKEIVGL
jgi:tetratricopeptide (TPR) repeat protein